MIQLRSSALLLGALLLFGAGWAVGELRHSNQQMASKELLTSSQNLAAESAGMAEKALEQVLTCQESLHLCMRYIGVAPRTTAAPK